MKKNMNNDFDISLSLNPITRTITVKQGDNTIELTRNQVIGLKKLKEHQYETDVYTAQVFPYNTFRLQPTGLIDVSCKSMYHNATLTLNSIACKGIQQFTEANKGRIAWDMDLKRK